MKEKQIEQNLREQMLALESQMKRLQEWRDTGYSATICNDDMHNWVEKDRHSMGSGVIVIVDGCQTCGLEKFSKHVLESKQFSDEWLEFREGGEEE
jgi:hypothetical protein